MISMEEALARWKIINYVSHSKVKCVRSAARYYLGLRGTVREWTAVGMKIDYHGFMAYVKKVYHACQGQYLVWEDYKSLLMLSTLVNQLPHSCESTSWKY